MGLAGSVPSADTISSFLASSNVPHPFISFSSFSLSRNPNLKGVLGYFKKLNILGIHPL